MHCSDQMIEANMLGFKNPDKFRYLQAFTVSRVVLF